MVKSLPVLRPVKVKSSTLLLSSRCSGERSIIDTNGFIVRRTRLLGTVDLMIRAGWAAAVVVGREVLLSPSTVVVGVVFWISFTAICFTSLLCQALSLSLFLECYSFLKPLAPVAVAVA